MTNGPQDTDRRMRQADVSSPPFIAGVLLGISGLNTLVEGLYTISYWQGLLFIVLGIIVAATGVMLIYLFPRPYITALVVAFASLIISAIWVATYHWFNLASIGLDLLAIYSLARAKLLLRKGRDPLRN